MESIWVTKYVLKPQGGQSVILRFGQILLERLRKVGKTMWIYAWKCKLATLVDKFICDRVCGGPRSPQFESKRKGDACTLCCVLFYSILTQSIWIYGRGEYWCCYKIVEDNYEFSLSNLKCWWQMWWCTLMFVMVCKCCWLWQWQDINDGW